MTTKTGWMIDGASGFTGRVVAFVDPLPDVRVPVSHQRKVRS
jgi:hypothetical protein